MWLMVVLGARLGALPWGRAPILDPLHRRANLVCSPNVIHSRVAALNRNCQLWAERVRLWKRICVRGAPSNSSCDSAPICHVSAHVLVMGASFAATGSTELCARRFLHLLATAAYRREALEQLRAMSGMRAQYHAVLRARWERDCCCAAQCLMLRRIPFRPSPWALPHTTQRRERRNSEGGVAALDFQTRRLLH